MMIKHFAAKEELIHWINDLKNEEIIDELLKIKEKISFHQKMKNGISSEEARNKTIDFLKSLDWKKE